MVCLMAIPTLLSSQQPRVQPDLQNAPPNCSFSNNCAGSLANAILVTGPSGILTWEETTISDPCAQTAAIHNSNGAIVIGIGQVEIQKSN